MIQVPVLEVSSTDEDLSEEELIAANTKKAPKSGKLRTVNSLVLYHVVLLHNRWGTTTTQSPCLLVGTYR